MTKPFQDCVDRLYEIQVSTTLSSWMQSKFLLCLNITKYMHLATFLYLRILSFHSPIETLENLKYSPTSSEVLAMPRLSLSQRTTAPAIATDP